MRVIAGSIRGKKLAGPKGRAIRPTSDKVKEAIFSRLSAGLEGSAVLDLFCGSGALAIEALSRGATEAVLVDDSREAQTLTARNLALTGLVRQTVVMPMSVDRALQRLAAAARQFHLILLDPPYDCTDEELISWLAGAAGLLSEDGVIVLETAGKRQYSLPPGLQLETRRRYGDTAVSYLIAAD